jgi:hypothetical protein
MAGLCGVLMVLLAGCHVYTPVTAPSPDLGQRYRFTLTDAGRAAIAERAGVGVLEIDGDLATATAEEFTIRVWGVRTIADGFSRWSGEAVALRREHLANVAQRQFSRGRTALAVGGVVAAVVTFAITRRLIGSGADKDDDEKPEPPLN